jgi:hypothetical protein
MKFHSYDHNYFATPSDPYYIFVNTDVSRYILVLDTSVFMKDNMDLREFQTLLIRICER